MKNERFIATFMVAAVFLGFINNPAVISFTQSVADGLYLKLDGSNDPVTGDVTFDDNSGNSPALWFVAGNESNAYVNVNQFGNFNLYADGAVDVWADNGINVRFGTVNLNDNVPITNAPSISLTEDAVIRWVNGDDYVQLSIDWTAEQMDLFYHDDDDADYTSHFDLD